MIQNIDTPIRSLSLVALALIASENRSGHHSRIKVADLDSVSDPDQGYLKCLMEPKMYYFQLIVLQILMELIMYYFQLSVLSESV